MGCWRGYLSGVRCENRIESKLFGMLYKAALLYVQSDQSSQIPIGHLLISPALIFFAPETKNSSRLGVGRRRWPSSIRNYCLCQNRGQDITQPIASTRRHSLQRYILFLPRRCRLDRDASTWHAIYMTSSIKPEREFIINVSQRGCQRKIRGDLSTLVAMRRTEPRAMVW